MNWNGYLLLYCGICYILLIGVYLYNIWKAPERNDIEPIYKLIIFIAAPLIPFILSIGLFIEGIFKKIKLIVKNRKEMKLKQALGLRPDEEYLCFWKMGGVGVIKCKDCGYQERITCFTHGFSSCTIGRQCPNCHAFVYEFNESQNYHTFGEAKEDFICKHCGTVIRKKEESISKGDDVPLLYPKCHSARLTYFMEYIT